MHFEASREQAGCRGELMVPCVITNHAPFMQIYQESASDLKSLTSLFHWNLMTTLRSQRMKKQTVWRHVVLRSPGWRRARRELRFNPQACALADVDAEAKPWPEMWTGQSSLSLSLLAIYSTNVSGHPSHHFCILGASIPWWLKVKALESDTVDSSLYTCDLLAMLSCVNVLACLTLFL